jgi:hypothetical protein
VNPALAGVALAVVVGAVVAGSARNARTAIFGLVVTMIGVPLVADPSAAPLGLAARLVAAILAGYLLWIATRGHHVRTAGSRVGWPTDAFLAAAAAVVGYGSHGLGAPAAGPALAAAAGFALAALAVLPVVTGRESSASDWASACFSAAHLSGRASAAPRISSSSSPRPVSSPCWVAPSRSCGGRAPRTGRLRDDRIDTASLQPRIRRRPAQPR